MGGDARIINPFNLKLLWHRTFALEMWFSFVAILYVHI